MTIQLTVPLLDREGRAAIFRVPFRDALQGIVAPAVLLCAGHMGSHVSHVG